MSVQGMFNDVSNISTVQRETLTNPHFNSFDEINFDELLDIALLLDIIKALILGTVY